MDTLTLSTPLLGWSLPALLLIVALALALPAVWGADVDAIMRTVEQLMHGVRVGGVKLTGIAEVFNTFNFAQYTHNTF